MTKTPKRKFWFAIAFVCLVLAGFLCWLLVQNPTFNPSILYNNDEFLAGTPDRFHAQQKTGLPAENATGSSFSMAKFSGFITLQLFSPDGGTVEVNWDLAVTSGLAKIILVDVTERTVLHPICEGTGSGTMEILLPEGNYALRIVGSRAAVQGSWTIT